MITVYNSLTVNNHTVHILDIKAANKPRVLTIVPFTDTVAMHCYLLKLFLSVKCYNSHTLMELCTMCGAF